MQTLFMLLLVGLIFGLSKFPKIGVVVFLYLSYAGIELVAMIVQAFGGDRGDAIFLIPIIQSATMIGFVMCFLQIGKGYTFKIKSKSEDDGDDIDDV